MVALKFATHGEQRYYAGALTLIFLLPICLPVMRFVLENRLLMWVGFVSYPLYLVHENMLVALTVKLVRLETSVPAALLPLPPILLAMLIAWLVARYAEPAIQVPLSRVAKVLRGGRMIAANLKGREVVQ